MKFLIDEDVPVKLLRVLQRAGHDAIRVDPSTSDQEVAARAQRESRILVTLDKDFANPLAYPPANLTIVQIRLHPPSADVIAEAFHTLLNHLPEKELRGLIVIQRSGILRFSE